MEDIRAYILVYIAYILVNVWLPWNLGIAPEMHDWGTAQLMKTFFFVINHLARKWLMYIVCRESEESSIVVSHTTYWSQRSHYFSNCRLVDGKWTSYSIVLDVTFLSPSWSASQRRIFSDHWVVNRFDIKSIGKYQALSEDRLRVHSITFWQQVYGHQVSDVSMFCIST